MATGNAEASAPFDTNQHRYLKYSDASARKMSFEKFPKEVPVSIESLVEAGFFYVRNGVDDNVICFSCGLTIKNWKAADEPWMLHASLRPVCRFMVKTHGKSRIEAVINMSENQQEVQTFKGPLTEQKMKELMDSAAVKSCQFHGYLDEEIMAAIKEIAKRRGRKDISGRILATIMEEKRERKIIRPSQEMLQRPLQREEEEEGNDEEDEENDEEEENE